MCRFLGCYCNVNGRLYDLSFILIKEPILSISILRSLAGCSLLEAKGAVTNILKNKKIPKSLCFENAHIDSNIICPKCMAQGDNIVTRISESGASRLECQICNHNWRSWK